MGAMTPREQRLARLREQRDCAASYVIEHFKRRNRDRQYDHRGIVRREIAWCRILDAKIASLTALTPFMRETVVRMCRQVHQGSTSALYSAVWDVEERVTA
jgi:hypothetical protein